MESTATQSPEPIIVMKGVTAGSMHDPAATVLSEVDWEVRAGDFWAVAGLQGSGKSDFLMLTAGLMAPLSGQYQLFGEPMPIFEDDRLPTRMRLGLVFEHGQLFNHLTISENVGLPLRYHKNLPKEAASEQVQAMLEKMELAPWADSTPGALGRNWHKRVGLARALMLKPEILLLDNPLAGLDLRHIYWWLDILGQLARGQSFVRNEPITIVVTTADLRLWMELGRKFAVINEGRMKVFGERSKLEAASSELLGELLTPEHRNA